MTTSTLSPHRRYLAALAFEPMDRLPFWPKIDPAYARAQAGDWQKMDVPALHRAMGSTPQRHTPRSLREVRQHSDIRERVDGDIWQTTYVIREAELKTVHHFDEPSQSWHPVTFPVQGLRDIELLTEWFEDCRAEIDTEAMAQTRALNGAIGQDAATFTSIGTTALMQWVESLAGVENAHFWLHDYPEQCAALFAAIQRDLLRRAELLAEHHPADLLYMMENTSTTLISVDQYQRLDWPHLDAIAQVVRGSGRRLMLHMCGHLQALLPGLARLIVTGFEAFTAPTLGNATLAQGRAICPDKALIGGTHATLWLEPLPVIVRFIEDRLEELPHHRGLIVSSAGLMPPGCPPEKIIAVRQWLDQYPLRN